MSGAVDELAALLPQPHVLRLGQRVLEITPIRVNEIQAFSRAIAPMAEALQGLALGGAAGPAGPAHWLTLVSEHTASVVQAVAVATRTPKEWVEELTVGELILLATVVVEVNADFLLQVWTQQAWPVLSNLVSKLLAKVAPQAEEGVPEGHPEILAMTSAIPTMPGATPSSA